MSHTTHPSGNRPAYQCFDACSNKPPSSSDTNNFCPEIRSMLDFGVNVVNFTLGSLTRFSSFFQTFRRAASAASTGVSCTSLLHAICGSKSLENSFTGGGLAYVVTGTGVRRFCSISLHARSSSHMRADRYVFGTRTAAITTRRSLRVRHAGVCRTRCAYNSGSLALTYPFDGMHSYAFL